MEGDPVSDSSQAHMRPRAFTSEMVLVAMAIVSGLLILWMGYFGAGDIKLQIIAGIAFTLSLFAFIRLLMDPDSVRARQSDSVLRIASQTLRCTTDGLTQSAAQEICELLLPATAAIAVAITDREDILGYAGYTDGNSIQGRKIRTRATHLTLDDGITRILDSPEDIGLPHASRIKGAIIVPLYIGRDIRGTLKFYYRHSRQISRTQESMAVGFAELLSTQMAASALEEQTRLATSMELKALQAQINPHFLFNTINTIASLIRTDPAKARVLLRDFAVFYRRTLEDSADLIALDREVEQVRRYFSFEIARFGEGRLQLDLDIDPAVGTMMVPSFLIQPLVENSVRHAMPAVGCLTVKVSGHIEDGDVVIRISDDGMGMTDERRNTIMCSESSTGLGIAVKNVRDRMKGYFGSDARMDIQSVLGEGTVVSFVLGRQSLDPCVVEGTSCEVDPVELDRDAGSMRPLAENDPAGYRALKTSLGD